MPTFCPAEMTGTSGSIMALVVPVVSLDRRWGSCLPQKSLLFIRCVEDCSYDVFRWPHFVLRKCRVPRVPSWL